MIEFLDKADKNRLYVAKNVLKRYFATSISFQCICSITVGNCLRIQRIRSRNKALPYFDINIVIITKNRSGETIIINTNDIFEMGGIYEFAKFKNRTF